jgi:aspartyl protease family protein
VAAPRAAAPTAAVEPQRAVPTSTLVYRADPQGHVILEAVVNGTPMRFMLDTGATAVALTARDAAAAGIARYQLGFTGRAETANGSVRVAPVRLREIRLGQLSIEDVSAVVIDNLEISLLGQSFLRKLQSYEMRDGVLTITW